jgi:hypothetical protein
VSPPFRSLEIFQGPEPYLSPLPPYEPNRPNIKATEYLSEFKTQTEFNSDSKQKPRIKMGPSREPFIHG